VDGTDISTLSSDELADYRAAKVGFVFQSYNLIPTLTVLENISLVEEIAPNHMSAQVLLTEVGLADHAHQFPHELSGGEQQRVSIARAIIYGPPLLIADEPTGNLDPKNSMEVMKILEQINAIKGITVLVSTHDQALVDHFRKRVITIENGQIVRDIQAGTYE
jgi:ABC-type lipoprotein export system ATPase subunit